MLFNIKKNIKKFIPPVIINKYIYFTEKYGFSGEYIDWESAKKESSGYDSVLILNKTKDALLKVKNNEAGYERDSVVFDKIQYSWPVLSFLLYISMENNNKLKLLDFGGSMGSSYYQNNSFLNLLNELKWDVLEQEMVSEYGQKYFADEHLNFYSDVDDYLKNNLPMVVLFSASLQYLEDPYKILDKIFLSKIKYVIIDRLVVNHKREIITVQNVNPDIYQASYPLRLFKECEIVDYFLRNNYHLVAEFDSLGGDCKVKRTDISAFHAGYFFKLN